MDKYVENKAAYGERFARQYLKTNMAHFRAKEAGQDVPPWEVYLTEKGLTTGDGVGLLELTEKPLTSNLSDRVSDNIKSRVPVEMETVRHANTLAFSGADTIFMPEHVSDSRGIFVRFVTKYKRDSTDPNKYQGSQIDLGRNMPPREAMEKMLNMMGSSRRVQSLQSNTYKDAFAFAMRDTVGRDGDVVYRSHTTTHGREELVTNKSPHAVASGPMMRLRVEGKIDHRVLEQDKNKMHRIDIVDDIVREGAKIGRKVAIDTKTTLVAASLFALEALKKRKKSVEKKSTTLLVEKIRSVFERGRELQQSGGRQLQELLRHADRRIREAGKQFISRVVGRWQEMMAVKSLFAFAAESGVGIGVALLGLRFIMTRELPKAPNVQHLERALPKRSAPDTAVEREKVKKLKRVRAIRGFQSGVDKITLKRYFVKKKIQGLGLAQPVTEGLKKIFLKKDRVRVSAPETKGHVVKPIERLWKTLRVLTRRLERLKKRSFRTVPQEEKSTGQKQKKERMPVPGVVEVRPQETVLQFSFALTLWVFLSEGRASRPTKGSKNSSIRLETAELLPKVEPRPWILLGIIWYLSMIRESGQQNYPIIPASPAGRQLSNTTNHQIKNSQQNTLLHAGVIFAFTS